MSYLLIKNDDNLICSDDTIKKIKNIFSKNFDISMIAIGVRSVGKKYTLMQLVNHIPYINKDKCLHFKDLKVYRSDFINNILYYKNFYFINLHLYTVHERKKLITFILNTNKNTTILNEKKIYLITNIELLSKYEQNMLANVLERNISKIILILTSNSSNIDKKLISLACRVRFSKLNLIQFKKKVIDQLTFLNNDKKNDDYNNYYYEIYENNNYNLNYTIHQLKFLLNERNLNLKSLSKKMNRMSLMEKICTKLINKYVHNNLINKITNLKKDIQNIIAININIKDFLNTFIKILINAKLNSDKLNKIISLCNTFFTKDKIDKIVLLENIVYNIVITIKT